MKRFAFLVALLFLVGCATANGDQSAPDGEASAVSPPGNDHITRERALEIATGVDSTATWQISFDDAFEYEFNGEKQTREVWIAQTLSPAANLTLWIDAKTG